MGEDYRFGIEEEFFVNGLEKRDLPRSRMSDFFDLCRENLSGDIQLEMLEPQVEVATPPCPDFARPAGPSPDSGGGSARWRRVTASR
jgi:carboxylate-amine ligase